MQRRSFVLLVALTVALVAAACQSSGSSPSAEASGLDGTWQWTASTEAVPASQSVVPDPENYTITFDADGTAAIKADCNSVTATYTTAGSAMTITLGASTMAMCAETSLGTMYTVGLGQVASYAVAGDELTLTFADDAGTMTFARP